MTDTLDVTGAAKYLRMAKDTVVRKARLGKISGAKIGKNWIFLKEDLAEDIRRGYSCRYTDKKAQEITIFDSRSEAKRLEDRLAQPTGKKPKSLSRN